MAYKNSGAMKFNDATDLVIRADPDGTVESCYNLSDTTEYIDDRFIPPINYNVKITNNASSAKTVYYATLDSAGILNVATISLASGNTSTIAVFKHSSFFHTSAPTTIISGDATIISNTKTKIDSDCELEFTD